MEQSEEIKQLLEEIRDLQREHLGEYKRISEQVIELNKINSERTMAQYKESLKSGKAMTWAIVILIAACLVFNFVTLSNMSKIAHSIESHLINAPERDR